jgi:hypothetical protein
MNNYWQLQEDLQYPSSDISEIAMLLLLLFLLSLSRERGSYRERLERGVLE